MQRPSIYRLLGLPRPSKQLFRVLRGPYSQDELARKLKVYPQTVQAWEQRRANPAPEHLRALHAHFLAWARAAKCDPRRLLTPVAALRTRVADRLRSDPERAAATYAQGVSVSAPIHQAVGTPAAPHETAANQHGGQQAPPSGPASPHLSEGDAK